ncbi:MAG TPA: ABC transporter permease [Spirochaetales bacterium]|nr:ABC transporter permease [Spirochaetales bacterium]HPS15241.1 ABC transporter permease [Spirochaetales bacterium]
MKNTLATTLKNYGIILAFIIICAALAILSPVFLTRNNILNVIRQTSIYGIMAVGMTFVILTGGIDLSVGSVLALSGAICAGLLKGGSSMFVAIVAAIGVGVACGLVNGLFITKARIPPFVVTLGMTNIARGLTLIYTKGYPVSGFSPAFREIGGGYVAGIPIPIIIFLSIVLIAYVVLSQTKLGRYTYAIGGNEETVKLSGVNSSNYKTLVYVISGLTCAISALILTARLNSAEPIAGTGYETDVIAAVCIGGASMSGGRGSVWGSLLGALLIGVLNNGMNLLGVSPYFQQVVKGLIIICAVWLDRMKTIKD